MQMEPQTQPQDKDIRALFQLARRLEAAVGETRDLIAGTGRDPGLAELVRGLVRSVEAISGRLEDLETDMANQASRLQALEREPDMRLAGAVRALWVPLAAAGVVALVGAAALGLSIRMAAAAQAAPPPKAPLVRPHP